MKTTRARRVGRAALCAVSVVSVAAAALAASAGGALASRAGGANPIVRIDDGLVRGAQTSGVSSFLGLPYAAPPTEHKSQQPATALAR